MKSRDICWSVSPDQRKGVWSIIVQPENFDPSRVWLKASGRILCGQSALDGVPSGGDAQLVHAQLGQ